MFKLCTFSTDQIKEFVGEVYLCIVGRDMDKGKGGGKNSHREIEKKYTTGYQNLQNKNKKKKRSGDININYTSMKEVWEGTKTSSFRHLTWLPATQSQPGVSGLCPCHGHLE